MQWAEPEVVVDITDTINLMLEALASHVSQFGDFARVEARVRERAAELGRPRRHAYAEAFDRILLPREPTATDHTAVASMHSAHGRLQYDS
jgi:LmbE family N-acetylglucosaminyl deacetylase